MKLRSTTEIARNTVIAKMDENQKSYLLPTESLPGLKIQDHLSDLVEIKHFFENRNISTANTRIERYIQYLQEIVNNEEVNEFLIFKNSLDERFKSRADWLLYILREIHELMWILRGLKVHIPAGLDGKLAILVSGSDFAALDTNPDCRNVQFELRISSYFCQAGYIVDLSSNTDIIAVKDKFAFFVECKRIGSIAQLHKRLTEARKQLNLRMQKKYDGKYAYGLIAADVTKTAYSHNGLTFGLTNEHSMKIIQKKLIEIANTIIKEPIFSGGRNLILYWLQIHIPCLITHPPATITRFSSYYIQNPGTNGNGWAALDALRNVNNVGYKKDEREIPPLPLTPRTKLSLPKGTEFKPINEEIVREILKRGQVSGIKQEEIIATLTFDGFKHEFYLTDLETLFASEDKQELERLSENKIETRLELILKMYMRRFPYENSDLPVQKTIANNS